MILVVTCIFSKILVLTSSYMASISISIAHHPHSMIHFIISCLGSKHQYKRMEFCVSKFPVHPFEVHLIFRFCVSAKKHLLDAKILVLQIQFLLESYTFLETRGDVLFINKVGIGISSSPAPTRSECMTVYFEIHIYFSSIASSKPTNQVSQNERRPKYLLWPTEDIIQY